MQGNDHRHEGMAIPDETGDRFGARGQRIDGSALAALVGAAIDGCVPCQTAQLDTMQHDLLTLTRLVELSAIAMQGIAGGLPDSMTTADDSASTLGADYRAMLRAGVDQEDHAPMYAIAAALDVAGRRQVAEDAIDMLTGALTMGAPE